MDIEMRVHRVSTHHIERTVTHEGEEARAMVAELEVELTDASGGGHGSIALHFRSQAKIAEAKQMFTQGGAVTMSFSASAAAPGGDRNHRRACRLTMDSEAETEIELPEIGLEQDQAQQAQRCCHGYRRQVSQRGQRHRPRHAAPRAQPSAPSG